MREFLTAWRSMSGFAKLQLLCIILALGVAGLIFVRAQSAPENGAQTVPDGHVKVFALANGSEVDSSSSSCAVILWGEPLLTSQTEINATQPDWLSAAYKTGGLWTNAEERTCWYVPAAETGEASLNVELDRAAITNNAVLVIVLSSQADASLHVALYDKNKTVVVEDLAGNLLNDKNGIETITLEIPLKKYPGVAGISIRRGSGEITVYQSLLYLVDQDLDDSDSIQEEGLKTSDLASKHEASSPLLPQSGNSLGGRGA